MADSVDRVFNQAINTVGKVYPGSLIPPIDLKLKLYSLYKQGMEGDIDGLLERPVGTGTDVQLAQAKWDAWKAQNGMPKTEAKRRYVTALIEAMHVYAADSPDNRELISELEYVWNQVKMNMPSIQPPPDQSGQFLYMLNASTESAGKPINTLCTSHGNSTGVRRANMRNRKLYMRKIGYDGDSEVEEFVDAPDSQYNASSTGELTARELSYVRSKSHQNIRHDMCELREFHQDEPTHSSCECKDSELPIKRSYLGYTRDQKGQSRRTCEARNQAWQRRMEKAIIKLTTEVTALREQLETMRNQRFSLSLLRRKLFRINDGSWLLFNMTSWTWAVIKHLMVDLVLIAAILAYIRLWNSGSRFELMVNFIARQAIESAKRSRLVKLLLLGYGRREKSGLQRCDNSGS